MNQALRPRWRKILADLWNNKIRTLLIVACIATGTFAVGLVTSAYIIMSSDVDADYRSVKPHAIVIYSQPFNDDMVQTMQNTQHIAEAEGRSAVSVRVAVNAQQKLPITVIAIPEPNKIKLDLLRPIQPAAIPPLADQEIFLERSSLGGLKVQPGDSINLELRGGRIRQVKVAAIVNDLTATPYPFTGQLTAYTNRKTLIWLGGISDYNQLYLRTTDDIRTKAETNQIAEDIGAKMEKSGLEVYKTLANEPGKHYASDFLSAMGILLGSMGALAVLLSGFLSANIITALLSQHIRQIGIMKSIGASSAQLIIMYIVLVLCFGVMALAIALPLSAIAAYKLSATLAGFLNFNLSGFRIPFISILLQVIVSLAVPVGAALVPVLSSTRITIRSAINNIGTGNQKSAGSQWIDRLIERVRSLPRPLLLSLRNVFRRKGRLALTLGTLILGGSIFIAVFNLRTSLNIASTESMGYFLSNVNVFFSRAYRIEQIEALLNDVPGVIDIEGWAASEGRFLSADEETSEEIIISAPPAGSQLIRPVITEGRWLVPEDQNAIVVSNHLIKKRPDLKVGDEVVIKTNGKKSTWRVVGICTIAGQIPIPLIYTNKEYLEKLQDAVNMVSEFHITTTPQDGATQKLVAQIIEAKLNQQKLQVSKITTGQETSNRLLVLINLLVVMLLTMAVLIAAVGGLGLTSMMSQNVFERTREIGIMRAIGAGDLSIQQIVIAEGAVIGILSWFFALFLALPISLVLEQAMGDPVIGAALPVVAFSLDGPLFWLIGVLLLSTIASYLPARNASRLTIREVLAYE